VLVDSSAAIQQAGKPPAGLLHLIFEAIHNFVTVPNIRHEKLVLFQNQRYKKVTGSIFAARHKMG
jgi:hypothetical protein